MANAKDDKAIGKLILDVAARREASRGVGCAERRGGGEGEARLRGGGGGGVAHVPQ